MNGDDYDDFHDCGGPSTGTLSGLLIALVVLVVVLIAGPDLINWIRGW